MYYYVVIYEDDLRGPFIMEERLREYRQMLQITCHKHNFAKIADII